MRFWKGIWKEAKKDRLRERKPTQGKKIAGPKQWVVLKKASPEGKVWGWQKKGVKRAWKVGVYDAS